MRARALEEGHCRPRAGHVQRAHAKGPRGGAQSGGACSLVSWRGAGGDEAGKAGQGIYYLFKDCNTEPF